MVGKRLSCWLQTTESAIEAWPRPKLSTGNRLFYHWWVNLKTGFITKRPRISSSRESRVELSRHIILSFNESLHPELEVPLQKSCNMIYDNVLPKPPIVMLAKTGLKVTHMLRLLKEIAVEPNLQQQGTSLSTLKLLNIFISHIIKNTNN